MRAWVVESLDAGGMALRDVAMPRAEGDSCVMRVAVAGVNFLDTLMVRGQYQVKPKLPFTPGIEVVGEVTQPGPDSPYAVGERICAVLELGGYAEYALVPRLASVRVPAAMPGRAAAGLPIIYPTAYLALRQRAGLQPGETVLVHAGAGGVGSAAIQLARHWGARVLATAGGADKVALCRDLGAHAVIDYRAESLLEALRREAPGGVDVVIDSVGGDVTRDSLRCLAWGGRLVIVGFAGGKIAELPANRLLLKNASAMGVYWGEYRTHHPELVERVFAELFDLYAAGVVRPLVRDAYPLADAPAALRAMAARETVGKVVLLP